MTKKTAPVIDDRTLDPVARVMKDSVDFGKQRGGGMTTSEARYLVDLYYTMQGSRIVVNNQVLALERDAKKTGTPPEPHLALSWVLNASETLETQIKKILSWYVVDHPMYWFFDNTLGIGPVLAAGLLAHIDITKSPTVGHIWSFAGLNPLAEWKKGERRPWNAALKVLCWKIGDSFVKNSSREDAYYGQLYRKRKELEIARNEAGAFADQAKKILATKTFRRDTKAKEFYEKGLLPPGHIDMRARRYAVKMFLSHLHECWYSQEVGPPPAPFSIAIQGHAHYLPPPQPAAYAAQLAEQAAKKVKGRRKA